MDESLHPLSLTHARLRRAQGDRTGAVAILEALIDHGDEGDDLWQLYVLLGGERQRPHSEPELPSPAARESAAASDLAAGFRAALGDAPPDARIARLKRWGERIQQRSRER